MRTQKYTLSRARARTHTHTRTHAHKHARTQTNTHARARTHTFTQAPAHWRAYWLYKALYTSLKNGQRTETRRIKTLKNGQRTETRRMKTLKNGQRTETRRMKTLKNGQRTETRRMKTLKNGQRTETRRMKTAARNGKHGRFGKRNVLRLDVNESRKGFCRRGRGRSFPVAGRQRRGNQHPVGSLVRGIWRPRGSEAERRVREGVESFFLPVLLNVLGCRLTY